MITLEKPIISRDSDTKAFTIDMAPTVNNSNIRKKANLYSLRVS